jgi:hypothetical protein
LSAGLSTVTVAPGRTAPFGSLITPCIVDVIWANPGVASKSNRPATLHTRKFDGIEVSIRSSHYRRCARTFNLKPFKI